MPIYEYICGDREARYERLVMRQNSERVACSKCGNRKAALPFSGVSGARG